ncbi:MAG: hypothetical protein NTW98_02895 [Candidatus Nomurabacteria bacterium]|nr:hypothetical protein [Candidatus Nomurabacteria bacterium]
MIYNIHPLFVHFPIALLLVYSLIKILPLAKYFPNVAWKHIERALLVFGVLGAFASMTTGETAEHLTNPNEKLVETHAFFASFSTWVYGLLLAGEILSYLNVSFVESSSLCWVYSYICHRHARWYYGLWCNR